MADQGGEENRGGRKAVVTDRQILRLFIEVEDPVVSAPELAEELPISKTGVYKRLVDLDERGLVESKKFGQGKAWWITDEGREYLEETT